MEKLSSLLTDNPTPREDKANMEQFFSINWTKQGSKKKPVSKLQSERMMFK